MLGNASKLHPLDHYRPNFDKSTANTPLLRHMFPDLREGLICEFMLVGYIHFLSGCVMLHHFNVNHEENLGSVEF